MTIREDLPPHYQNLVNVIENAREDYEREMSEETRVKLARIIIHSMDIVEGRMKYDTDVDRVLIKGYFDYLLDMYGRK